MTYTLRRDVDGIPTAIERDGATILLLHVAPHSEAAAVNEDWAVQVIDMLNAYDDLQRAADGVLERWHNKGSLIDPMCDLKFTMDCAKQADEDGEMWRRGNEGWQAMTFSELYETADADTRQWLDERAAIRNGHERHGGRFRSGPIWRRPDAARNLIFNFSNPSNNRCGVHADGAMRGPLALSIGLIGQINFVPTIPKRSTQIFLLLPSVTASRRHCIRFGAVQKCRQLIVKLNG